MTAVGEATSRWLLWWGGVRREEVGIAPMVRKGLEKASMLPHRAASQCTSARRRGGPGHGVRSRPDAWTHREGRHGGERRALGALWAAFPSTGQNSGTPFFRLTPVHRDQ